jgi:hypothetical protein
MPSAWKKQRNSRFAAAIGTPYPTLATCTVVGTGRTWPADSNKVWTLKSF